MAKEFTYKLNIDAETSALTNKLKQMKAALESITSDGKEPKISKIITQLEDKLDALKTKANTPIRSEAAFGQMEKDVQGVNRLLERLGEEIEAVAKKNPADKIGFLPPGEQKRLNEIVQALKTYKDAMAKAVQESNALLKAKENEDKANQALIKAQTRLSNLKIAEGEAKQSQANAKAALDEAKARQENVEKRREELEQVKELIAAKKAEAAEKGESFDARQAVTLEGGKTATLSSATKAVNMAEAAAAADDIDALTEAFKKAKAEAGSFTDKIGNAEGNVKTAGAAYADASGEVRRLTDEFNKSSAKEQAQAFNDLRQKAESLGVSLDGIGVDNTAENIALLQERMEQLVVVGVQPADSAMQEAKTVTTEMGVAADNTSAKLAKETDEFHKQNEAASNVTGLVNRIKQFTGLTGAALLMRRALQSAFRTIKELDQQMTEMAVVTDLGVGDYWKQLPEHTQRANELGMAINDVYKAETLYYQQGLKTAQVTQLSTSTLKMARIAGLSAEDATNKMTAALRGFNMEINETNADRVADVYSKLAAITASNVQEISTAMTKTASIASNAGMQFETTAAFLSQIIETTRESAETAGTALKTVIARFQELKKSPDEIGEIDGEIIDANKIETALRSVGVALRDAHGQFRDLDDVFIELASKWDTLDMNTQRYIATIAAGSRQQSRFVAMMSDYSRTQELVNAANNAAGASNEQFAKTLDSLQSKLAALKNAWDTFTMGLANNQFIKIAVDLLTGILNAINKITEGFGPWSSSALKIGLVTAALIAGDKAIKAFTASMKLNRGVLASFGAALKAPHAGLINLISSLRTGPKAMQKFATTVAGMKPRFEQWRNASQRVKEAQETLNNTLKTGDPKMFALSMQNLKDEQLNYSKVTATMASELHLTGDELKNMTELTDLGMKADDAAILAKQGYTTASLAQEAAANTGAAAEDASAVATYGAAVASQAATGADSARTGGLWAMLSAKYADWAATTATAVANGTYTGSAIAATVAQWSLTIAEWAGCPPLAALAILIGIVIAAMAILVLTIVGLVAMFKNIAKNTPEGKLNTATEALKQATEHADAATEAYDNLKESLQSIADKYDALDDLVVGTREWRDALLDVNAEVLDLIDKYPELAKYVSSENGVLKISEEGMDAVLDAQAKSVAQTQAAQINAQINKTNAEIDYKFSKLSDKAVAVSEALGVLGGIAAGATGFAPKMTMANGQGTGAYVGASLATSLGGPQLNRGITEAFAKALAEGEITDQADMKKWLEAQGMDSAGIAMWMEDIGDLSSDTAQELADYGRALNAATAANDAAMHSMINSAVAMVDANKYTQEQLQQMANIGTDWMAKRVQQEKAAQSGRKANGDNGLKNDKDYVAYWEGIYGAGNVKVGAYGKIQVKGDDGKYKDAVDADQAKEEYAVAKATEEASQQMEKLPIALSKVAAGLQNTNKNAQGAEKALNKAFNSDQGEGLARADLVNLTDDYLKAMWDTNDELREVYGDSEAGYADFMREMQKRTKLANQAFAQNRQQLDKIGLGGFTLDNTLTAGAEKGLIEHLSQVVAVSTPAIGKIFGDNINNLLGSVAEEDREKLAAQLNAIDWHDADALESLPETLREVGIYLPTSQLESFIANAKIAAKAIHNVDFSNLNEQLLNLDKMLQNIYTNQQGRAFDEEAYGQIIKLLPNMASEFVQNLEGEYVYLGRTMEDLTTAIENATDARIKEGADILQNRLNTANILDNIIGEGGKTFKSGNVMAMANSGNWTTADRREFIQAVINEANASGVDLTGVSSQLSNDTLVSYLDKDQLNTIITDLRSYYQQQDQLEKQFQTEVLQALTTSNLKQNTYFNGRDSIASRAAEQSTVELDQTTIEHYQAQRASVQLQAQQMGISETDLKLLMDYEDYLQLLERQHQTGTETYRKAAKAYNDYMKVIGNKTSYQIMYNGMTENVTATYELLQAYQETTDEAEKMFLASKMMEEFGIQVTEDNYGKIAEYTEAYLYGQEQGFKNIANMAGVAAGILLDSEEEIFDRMEGHNYLEEMDATMQAFAKRMVDAGYAWIEDDTNIFHWGMARLNEEAKKAVEEVEAWENPYDWLWNANQRVNALLRERNRLERDYNNMLDDGGASLDQIANNLASQIQNLEQEAQYQRSIYDNAQEELTRMLSDENSAYTALLKDKIAVGPNGRIALDKDALFEANYTSEAGGVLSEIVDKVESLVDTMNSAEDSINDAEDSLREIKKTGKEQYNTLLDRVTEALRVTYQRQIDTLSAIHEAINDAATQLTDKLQEKIDDDRQARDLAKTEENLGDKQAQLAYLQAGGGNALDVLNMQKQIADDTQSYQDTLVDNALSELQEANQKAADQRQEQIDIAQAQFDWWSENTAIHDAERELNNSLLQISNGVKPENTGIGTLLHNTENISAKSKEGIQDWYNELGNQGNLAAIHAGLVGNSTNNNLYTKLGQNSATIANLQDTLTTGENSIKSQTAHVSTAVQNLNIGNSHLLQASDVVNLTDVEFIGKMKILADALNALKGRLTVPGVSGAPVGTDSGSGTTGGGEADRSGYVEPPNTQTDMSILQDALTKLNIEYEKAKASIVQNGTNGQGYANWEYIFQGEKHSGFTRAEGAYKHLTSLYEAERDELLKNANKRLEIVGGGGGGRYSQAIMAYAHGGLADSTGPAWLDGTKSNPELVLNATDTANFIELKTILADFLKDKTNNAGGLGGNNYYDIDVHVDSIDSDYDIDSAAARMRELIEDDAMYRNVNAVQQIR